MIQVHSININYNHNKTLDICLLQRSESIRVLINVFVAWWPLNRMLILSTLWTTRRRQQILCDDWRANISSATPCDGCEMQIPISHAGRWPSMKSTFRYELRNLTTHTTDLTTCAPSALPPVPPFLALPRSSTAQTSTRPRMDTVRWHIDTVVYPRSCIANVFHTVT
jgi:hypothetical protein